MTRGPWSIPEAAENQQEMLRLVSKRFRTRQQIQNRTGWTERSVQRYAVLLVEQGLITRSKEQSGCSWLWSYHITDKGRDALGG